MIPVDFVVALCYTVLVDENTTTAERLGLRQVSGNSSRSQIVFRQAMTRKEKKRWHRKNRRTGTTF